MLFTSPEFIIVFLPIVLFGYYTISQLNRNVAVMFLVFASLLFYSYWRVANLPGLLLSIGFNFWIGGRLLRTVGAVERRRILVLGITVNLLNLCFFKYLGLVCNSVAYLLGVAVNAPVVELPLGISFYTFTQIAFLVDVYFQRVKSVSLGPYALFVSYFPHLIAGPVLHHGQMIPQFGTAHSGRFQLDRFVDGLTVFLVGLAKKVLLADQLAIFADVVFNASSQAVSVSFFEAWGGALAYTFQLYFDFSGYSDMAIGLSKLMNIELPQNFAVPYASTSIIEFWRRWHITLSEFLRDYLYIPLGGNRCSTGRRYFNVFATMVIGGLWHGASWTFAVWGAFHGLLIVANTLFRRGVRRLPGGFVRPSPSLRVIFRLASWCLVFTLVVTGWVLFRSSSFVSAAGMLSGMLGLNGVALPEQILQWVPIAKGVVGSVGTVGLLGNGSVMGILEQFVLILVSLLFSTLGPTTSSLSFRSRLVIIACSFGFLVQGVFFPKTQSVFLYFQF